MGGATGVLCAVCGMFSTLIRYSFLPSNSVVLFGFLPDMLIFGLAELLIGSI